MAQHVALYEVLFDEGIELKQPQGDLDKEFTFTPPANTATDARSILNFMIGITNANNLKFRIALNGTVIAFINENGNRLGTFAQEVVPVVRPGQSNTVKCYIESGTGSVRLADMVIWYQRNV